ncbi:GSCOCG00000840001-RA-CDS [Cotesia congregata]|nr:GSCOCG00000840001-RA-CDS [Cotesia congregata]
MEKTKLLGKLPETKKLHSLALVGTHLSASYTTQDETLRTQDLTILQQLKYGVRGFDISVCPQSTHFELYPYPVMKGYNFYNILFEINKFLDENPGEFVIMLIKQSDYCDYLGSIKSNCEIIEEYIFNVWGGWRMVTSWRLDDIIGIYRNRILLANPSFAECSLDINSHCLTHKLQTSMGRKLHQIFFLTSIIVRKIKIANRKCNENFRCSIRDTTFLNQYLNRQTLARDGGFSSGDECGEPINLLMTNNFENLNCGLIIVIADFGTQDLIDKINDGNFKN